MIVSGLLKKESIEQEGFSSLCDLFKAQVFANPKKIAGIFKDNCLSYRELYDRSLQLAYFLRESGVQPQDIVALSIENGLNLLVGMLGILHAGATYLPIDPNYPVDRIESIVEDAKPVILLTENNLKSKFFSLPCNTVMMDAIPEGKTNEFLSLHPHHLAYIVYTSGSTGKPKGILLDHKALSYAALAHRAMHSIELTSLIAGSISFDASLLVIAHTLACGGTVCIPASNIAIDAGQIIDLIEKHEINYTLCIPSFYAMILNQQRMMPSLRYVDLGGDSIPNEMPRIHANLAPNAVLNNVYGPSEYAVGATFSKIYDPVSKEISPITIGKPFSETQVYILDEEFQQVRLGVKGEIFIGGPGLARGYLNRENLSEEKFLRISLSNQEPILLYRTGDFGRFLSDGNIEYLGRMDHQIKIRGFRIELGEVEHTIRQCPGINEAIVIAQDQENRSKRLVGYFSTSVQENMVEKLRQYLQDTLPQYMIPSSLVQIEQWPYTLNGKVDRAVLSLRESQLAAQKISRPPSSKTEQILFEIWRDVLNQGSFGVDDNFFELGGDSLLIACLQTRLETVMGFKISVSDFFEYPTISKFAQHLVTQEIERSQPANSVEFAKNQKSAFQQFKKKFHKKGLL